MLGNLNRKIMERLTQVTRNIWLKRLQQFAQNAWRFLQDHPPLLALAILALAIVGKDSFDAYVQRGAVHVGVAAYLLGVVGFVAFGRRNHAWPALAQIGAATALGLAVALLAQTYVTHSWQPGTAEVCAPASAKQNDKVAHQPAGTSERGGAEQQSGARDAKAIDSEAKKNDKVAHQPAGTSERGGAEQQSGARDAKAIDSEAKSPFEGINALAAVLAVALAVLTFVAQKSASEARSEAEKAYEILIGKRSEIFLIEVLTRVVLETQRLRESGRELSELYSMYEDSAPDLANLHRRWSELYRAVSIFLVDLLVAVDSGEVDQIDAENARIDLIADDLDRAHRKQSDAAAHDLLREQVRGYVSPLRRLLSRGIEVVANNSGSGLEHRHAVRKAMRKLDKSLSVLT